MIAFYKDQFHFFREMEKQVTGPSRVIPICLLLVAVISLSQSGWLAALLLVIGAFVLSAPFIWVLRYMLPDPLDDEEDGDN